MLSIVEGYNAGEVALLCVLGFVIVIAVLIVLVLILMLFSKGFGAAEKAAAGIKQRRAEATSAAEKAADEPENDGEIVAAITAAIAAIYESENAAAAEETDEPVPFVIRSIKKI